MGLVSGNLTALPADLKQRLRSNFAGITLFIQREAGFQHLRILLFEVNLLASTAGYDKAAIRALPIAKVKKASEME